MSETETIVRDSSILENDNPAVLARLVREEQTRVANGEFLPFQNIADGQQLLTAFKASPFYKNLFDQASEGTLVTQDKEDMSRYRGRLAGKVFESIVHAYLSTRVAEQNQVLISPEGVSELYPQDVMNTYVPDGIIIDPNTMEVKYILEYTLTDRPGKFRQQIHDHRKARMENPLLPQENELYFVIPSGKTPKGRLADRPRIFANLPFTRAQFRDFMRDFAQDLGLPLTSKEQAHLAQVRQHQESLAR